MPQTNRTTSALNSGQQACHCPNAAFTCPNRSKRLRLQPTTIHHHQQPSLHAEVSTSGPHMPTQVPDCSYKQAAPSQPLSKLAACRQTHCCCSRDRCEQQLLGVQMAQAPPLMEALLVSISSLICASLDIASSQYCQCMPCIIQLSVLCSHELHMYPCTLQETICSCFSRRPAWQIALPVGPPACLNRCRCCFRHAAELSTLYSAFTVWWNGRGLPTAVLCIESNLRGLSGHAGQHRAALDLCSAAKLQD